MITDMYMYAFTRNPCPWNASIRGLNRTFITTVQCMAYCTSVHGICSLDQNNKGLRIERHVERSYEGGKYVCNIRGVGGGGLSCGEWYRIVSTLHPSKHFKIINHKRIWAEQIFYHTKSKCSGIHDMHLYVGRILCTLYSNSIIFFFYKSASTTSFSLPQCKVVIN